MGRPPSDLDDYLGWQEWLGNTVAVGADDPHVLAHLHQFGRILFGQVLGELVLERCDVAPPVHVRSPPGIDYSVDGCRS